MLSETTVSRLGLKVGDELQLYFLEPGATVPRIRKVKLSGIFHTGMDEIDRDYGLCDLRLLQRINNWNPDEINGYQVDLDDEQYADSTAAAIFYNFLDAPLSASTMRDVYSSIFDWLRLQDLNAQIVLVIMAIVAIINLAVALLILIVEQARMVGVLKSLGMSNRKLQQVFLYHAGMIAIMGILLGNIIGAGLSLLQQKTQFIRLDESIYYMQHVPVRLLGWQILLIDGITLAVCIAIMFLPSLLVRKINIAKVIQFK
jgi:lipoprotein-releasing system permease protein